MGRCALSWERLVHAFSAEFPGPVNGPGATFLLRPASVSSHALSDLGLCSALLGLPLSPRSRPFLAGLVCHLPVPARRRRPGDALAWASRVPAPPGGRRAS